MVIKSNRLKYYTVLTQTIHLHCRFTLSLANNPSIGLQHCNQIDAWLDGCVGRALSSTGTRQPASKRASWLLITDGSRLASRRPFFLASCRFQLSSDSLLGRPERMRTSESGCEPQQQWEHRWSASHLFVFLYTSTSTCCDCRCCLYQH